MKFSVQKKIEQLATSSQRSTELIATFREGYADNWFMAVRECFRAQLDIKYTPRIEKRSDGVGKREVKHWTQGPRIAFDIGHTFYDTPLGYELWDKAIKQIKLACIVVEGKPNDIKKRKAGDELIEGFVVVEFLAPDADKTKLIKQADKKMSQNLFVEFLMHGNFYNGYHNTS
jgi:hypothetical protein